ncbi:hypothetical protein BKA81DRAFT_419611 [Phyllosticta paracitricarpa]
MCQCKVPVVLLNRKLVSPVQNKVVNFLLDFKPIGFAAAHEPVGKVLEVEFIAVDESLEIGVVPDRGPLPNEFEDGPPHSFPLVLAPVESDLVQMQLAQSGDVRVEEMHHRRRQCFDAAQPETLQVLPFGYCHVKANAVVCDVKIFIPPPPNVAQLCTFNARDDPHVHVSSLFGFTEEFLVASTQETRLDPAPIDPVIDGDSHVLRSRDAVEEQCVLFTAMEAKTVRLRILLRPSNLFQIRRHVFQPAVEIHLYSLQSLAKRNAPSKEAHQEEELIPFMRSVIMPARPRDPFDVPRKLYKSECLTIALEGPRYCHLERAGAIDRADERSQIWHLQQRHLQSSDPSLALP